MRGNGDTVIRLRADDGVAITQSYFLVEECWIGASELGRH
jgi:hypothetical protein